MLPKILPFIIVITSSPGLTTGSTLSEGGRVSFLFWIRVFPEISEFFGLFLFISFSLCLRHERVKETKQRKRKREKARHWRLVIASIRKVFALGSEESSVSIPLPMKEPRIPPCEDVYKAISEKPI
ncbi:hypothetical protein [Nitratifractor sp.]